MKTYAYLKKHPTSKESLSEQIKHFDFSKIDHSFVDEENSTKELERLITGLEKGDTLIIYTLSLVNFHKNDMRNLFLYLKKMAIRLILIKENMDTAKEEFSSFFKICILYQNVQKKIIQDTTKRSLARANKNGVTLGRPTIDEGTIEHINSLRNKQHKSIREIASICDVSIGTVHKYITS